jgi:hypothetical protein
MNKVNVIPVTLALLAVSFFGQGNGDFWGIKTAFGYGAGSSIATVSSAVYTVDDNNGTISNVPRSTAKATFLGNLTKDEPNQTWNSDGINATVATGNTLVVTAQDTTTTLTYTVTVNPPAPTITSVASDGKINNNEKAAVHVIGTAEANALVTVTLSDGTRTKTGTQQLTGGATAFDITINTTTAPALVDGNIGVAVVATNSLGGSSTAASTTAVKDVVLPDVTKLGTGAADYTIAATGTAVLTFTEPLSSAAKTAVEDALTIGANKANTYAWTVGDTVLTITGHATEVTTFANDVMANISDVNGNTNSVLLVDSAIDADQVQPDGSGDATVNSTTPELVVTDPVLPVNATIAANTPNPQINVSSFVSGGTGVLPEINITSNNAGNVNVAIPASTTVTSADPTWNGVIEAPTNTTVSLPSSLGNATATAAIQVGFSGAKLSFDKAVRIVVPGQAGKRAGYVRTGTAFTEITATCVNDTQATNDLLGVDADCKIDVGADLIIWTKHFTTFSAFTTTSASSSGGGGGGPAVASSFSGVPVSIVINNGDQRTLTTAVTLTLNGGANAKKMAIANGDNFMSSAQQDYATTKEWTLTAGEAIKKVCVRFYDSNGYYSDAVCDEIAFGANTSLPTVTVVTPGKASKNIVAIDALLPYLNYGQSNALVRHLQNELQKAGYFPAGQKLTNYYGNITRDAVAKYKADIAPKYTRDQLIQMIKDILISKGITLVAK